MLRNAQDAIGHEFHDYLTGAGEGEAKLLKVRMVEYS